MPANKRYTPDGMETWYFVPTIANTSAPTTAEVTAGVDITCSIKQVNGFKEKSNFVELPDLCSRVASKIPGRISLDDSSIEFYKSSDATSPDGLVFAALPQDTTGYILRFHAKDGAKQTVAASATAEVWPITVGSRSVNPPEPGKEVTWEADFAHPTAPVLSATLS